MATFVLVHGRFLGAWCFRRVVPRLRTSGHAILAPTLSGCGDRAHLLDLGARISLETHVQDVARAVEFHDVEEVVLVAHGSAGLLMPGVVASIRDRLAGLVFIDAWMPEEGRAFRDLCESGEAQRIEQAGAEGDGLRLAAPPVESLALSSAQDSSWVGARLTAHPLLPLTEAVPFSGTLPDVPCHYLHCICSGQEIFARVASRAAERGWSLQQLSSGHHPMLTTPRRLADALHGLVANEAAATQFPPGASPA